MSNCSPASCLQADKKNLAAFGYTELYFEMIVTNIVINSERDLKKEADQKSFLFSLKKKIKSNHFFKKRDKKRSNHTKIQIKSFFKKRERRRSNHAKI